MAPRKTYIRLTIIFNGPAVSSRVVVLGGGVKLHQLLFLEPIRATKKGSRRWFFNVYFCILSLFN